MSIAAYFQCYKQPLATYYALQSFRKTYPTQTIVLISDNGYNYSKMAKHFNCIYIHSDCNYPLINNIDDKYKLKVYGLIERILYACSLIKEEYIMWLEDDVYIHRPSPLSLQYDLNGYCPNTISSNHFMTLKGDFPNLNNEIRISGHGGSIYKKDSLVKSLINTNPINTLLDNWQIYFSPEANLCQDLFISILLHINGYSIGPLEGHGDSSELDSNFTIQHQYKKYYGIPMPEELSYLYEK